MLRNVKYVTLDEQRKADWRHCVVRVSAISQACRHFPNWNGYSDLSHWYIIQYQHTSIILTLTVDLTFKTPGPYYR